MAKGFSIQHVAATPPGWRVRTVKAGAHRVRVAFPPGRSAKGSGIPVEVLHPRNENPHGCLKNPSELLLMGANPLPGKRATRERAASIRAARLANPLYDKLSVDEKLAFGRLGLGKAQLQSRSDIRRARAMVKNAQRLRNRLPNPGVGTLPSLDAPQAEHARELREAFTESESDRYVVTSEPHVPAGDYADLGKLIALGVKPHGAPLQEISFPGKDIRVISNSSGRQIYLVGDGQELSGEDIAIFTDGDANIPELGPCVSIVYEAAKWHSVVPDSARGKKRHWEHAFGEDGGYPPRLFYDRAKQRLLLEGGSYHVEGAGIVN